MALRDIPGKVKKGIAGAVRSLRPNMANPRQIPAPQTPAAPTPNAPQPQAPTPAPASQAPPPQAPATPSPVPAQAPPTPTPAAPQPASAPIMPPAFEWDKLNKDAQSGLEAVVTNPLNGPFHTLQRIQEFAGRKDAESQKYAKSLADGFEKNLGWYYKALGITDENDIKQYTNAALRAFNSKDANAIKYVSAFMQEIAKRMYNGMPADKKSALAKKAFESDFESRFGIKLDAWKEGSLIDKLDFGSLPADAQKTILNALKEGESYQLVIGQYLQIKEAQTHNGDPVLKKKLTDKEKELRGKLKAYNSAALTAYGFSNEFKERANKMLDEVEPQLLIQLLMTTTEPLFKLASKKAALTLGTEQSGVEDCIAVRHMNEAYQVEA